MNSFSGIIDTYGTKRAAAVLGCTENHVRVMRFRDSIHPRFWDLIVRNPPEGQHVWVTHDLLRTLYADRALKSRAARPQGPRRKRAA
jgi:hypothetical protein